MTGMAEAGSDQSDPRPDQSPERKRGPRSDQNPVRVNFDFRRELAEKIEGDLASFCYQCGACVGDCPAATYSSTFNPREIMLKVLYGLGEELLVEDSVLWECTNCYNCHERCPQEVKPVEVIISLKNMLADRGQQGHQDVRRHRTHHTRRLGGPTAARTVRPAAATARADGRNSEAD